MSGLSSINPKLLKRIKRIASVIASKTGEAGSPSITINRVRSSSKLIAKLGLLKFISAFLVLLVLLLTILVLIMYWKLPEEQSGIALTNEELRAAIEAEVVAEARRRGLGANSRLRWALEGQAHGTALMGPLNHLKGTIELSEPSQPKMIQYSEKNFQKESREGSRGELSTHQGTLSSSKKSSFGVGGLPGQRVSAGEIVEMGLKDLQLKLSVSGAGPQSALF